MSTQVQVSPNQLSSPRHALVIGIFGFTLLSIVTATFLIVRDWQSVTFEPTSIIESEGGVSSLVPPRSLADFALIDHHGEALALSDLRGNPVVLSFGYTFCPDVCPLTLQTYGRVHDQLEGTGEEVAFVFVSVDGERDTPDRLAAYLRVREVDAFTIALTGTEGDLRRVGADYGLYFERTATDSGFYLVDHTASLYLIDSEGALAHIVAFGTDVDTITEHVRALMK